MSLKNSIVKIVACKHGHYFKMGDRVRILDDYFDRDGQIRAEYLDGHDYWYIGRDEFKFEDEHDMRGFQDMLGRLVSHVDTTAINVVHITFTDGFKLSIDAENRHFGIPVIQAVTDDY